MRDSRATLLDERTHAACKSRLLLGRTNSRRYLTFYAACGAAVLAAGLALFAINANAAMWPAVAAGIATIGLAIVAAQSAHAVTRQLRQCRWIERSLERINGEWIGSGDWGDDFRDQNHPYAEDLDVFGEGSLFELLAPQSCTVVGRASLADSLLSPSTRQAAVKRQQAVRELVGRFDLQMELCQVSASSTPDSGGAESLREWATCQPDPTPAWFRLGLLGLAASLLLACLLGLGGAVPSAHAYMAVVVIAASQLMMCWRVRDSIERTVSAIVANSRALTELESGANLLERERFDSELLRSLQGAMRAGSKSSASRLLASLNRRIAWLQARNADVLLPFAYLLAWATQWGLSIESWQIAHGQELTHWADAFGAFEGLCAIAAFAGDHPGAVFPSYQSGSQVGFVADNMQHPFLPEGKAVGNPVRLGAASRVLAITGSNMSGKSTYLRAIGLNYVLARAGAPVRASNMELSEFALVASTKIDESIHHRRSRFFSEASKLSSALKTSPQAQPVLLLADEILSGTNSHDRRIGARAVVEQLVNRGGSAVLTTHDVDLAESLSHLSHGKAAHFRDRVLNGELEFDYKLRPGIVRSSNALVLLRALQVDV